ncbi:Rrf2 family transcriptional regulator [bacterium]|nr:Rrf2 family transcriptional regulator [bacterium]MBU1065545.1 Rrf2 family transcriptional regulator [bacterium]MBU1633501.1 Rrf2 family transcriptional regulator [bacterium]MBU1873534.1 Rrf2 family transcriptional regulator [bacterium]
MLSKKTKYAIIALVRLAREYKQGALQIGVLAEEENIPKKFLEAILRDLKNAGILTSIKGRNGGYYLSQDPEKVNLATIIRLFNGPIAFIPCVTYLYYEACDVEKDEDLCGIRTVFKEVRDATVEIFKRATLAEIIRREDALRQQQ